MLRDAIVERTEMIEHTHGCVLVDFPGNSLLSHPYGKCRRFLILDFRLDSGVWV